MRQLPLLLAVVAALDLHAGQVIHYTSDAGNDPLRPAAQSGRLSYDAQRYRIDLDPAHDVRAWDVAISTDGDRTQKLINLQNGTWYERENFAHSTSRFFARMESIRNLKFDSHDEEIDEQIAGHPTRKHVVRFSFDSIMSLPGGNRMAGPHIEFTTMVWTAKDLPRAPIGPAQRTGIAEVDNQLVAAFAQFDGLILKQTTSLSRAFQGGRPSVELTTMTVDSIESHDLPDALFEVPKGLVNKKPQIASPGVTSH